MKDVKINQVVWNNRGGVLFVWTSEISFTISFYIPLGNKWLGLGRVRAIFVNRIPRDRIILLDNKKPPIRDINKLIEDIIEKFEIGEDNLDGEVLRWIMEKRQKKI